MAADVGIIGKLFKVPNLGWKIRVSVGGGAAGRFEKGPFEKSGEAAKAMVDLITKLEVLYSDPDLARAVQD